MTALGMILRNFSVHLFRSSKSSFSSPSSAILPTAYFICYRGITSKLFVGGTFFSYFLLIPPSFLCFQLLLNLYSTLVSISNWTHILISNRSICSADKQLFLLIALHLLTVVKLGDHIKKLCRFSEASVLDISLLSS